MALDFRQERKWKVALAFVLAHEAAELVASTKHPPFCPPSKAPLIALFRTPLDDVTNAIGAPLQSLDDFCYRGLEDGVDAFRVDNDFDLPVTLTIPCAGSHFQLATEEHLSVNYSSRPQPRFPPSKDCKCFSTTSVISEIFIRQHFVVLISFLIFRFYFSLKFRLILFFLI